MIEDRIEEAARKYAFNECSKKDIDQYDLDSLLFDAFCSGINWFKENLWHDASEEPKLGKRILTERRVVDTLIYEVHTTISMTLTWDYLKKHYDVMTRWLYIEDLMKGGK